MKTRVISILFLLMWITTACRSTAATVTPASMSTQTFTAGLPTQPVSALTPTSTPPVSNLVYPPPGGTDATTPAVKPATQLEHAGLNSVLLLKDTQQGKSIMAYYDPSLWQAGTLDNFNNIWSGRALNATTLTGCTLRYTGGFGPDPSWQSESVSVSLNPDVTLYEIFNQADGREVLRLYRVDGYDSAFAVRLDGVDAASQGKCIEQTEQILATIVVQAVYP